MVIATPVLVIVALAAVVEPAADEPDDTPIDALTEPIEVWLVAATPVDEVAVG